MNFYQFGLKNFQWNGAPIEEDAFNVYYSKLTATTTSTSTEKIEIAIGDKIYVHSAEKVPYIAEIIEFYHCKRSAVDRFKAKWFYRQSDLNIKGESATNLLGNEIFYSNNANVNDVNLILGKCFVLFFSSELEALPSVRLRDLYLCRYFVNTKIDPYVIGGIRDQKIAQELDLFCRVSDHIRKEIQAEKPFWNEFINYIETNLANKVTTESLNVLMQTASIDSSKSGNSASNEEKNSYLQEKDPSKHSGSKEIPSRAISPDSNGNRSNGSESIKSSIPKDKLKKDEPINRGSTGANSLQTATQPASGSNFEVNSVSIIVPASDPSVTMVHSAPRKSSNEKNPTVENKGKFNFKLKHLDLSKDDVALSIELFQQFQAATYPGMDVSIYNSDYFLKHVPEIQQLKPFLYKIQDYRKAIKRKEEKKKSLNAATSTAAPSKLPSEKSKITSQTQATNSVRILKKPGPTEIANISPLLLTTVNSSVAGGNVQSNSNKGVPESSSSTDDNLYFRENDSALNKTETEAMHSQNSWFTESDEEEEARRQGVKLPSSPFLRTSKGLVKKKRKRSREGRENNLNEGFQQKTIQNTNNDGDDDESIDPDEDYFEEDLAEIPELLPKINPSEHRLILQQAKIQVLTFDIPFPLDYYLLLAYEEILRIKLDFVIEHSNKSIHGQRQSVNSTGIRTVAATEQYSYPLQDASSSRAESSMKRLNIYGQGAPVVDGSLVIVHFDVHQIILEALVKSDYSVGKAVRSLHGSMQNKLSLWTAEDQRLIHTFLYSKDYYNMKKLKNLLPKKSMKEILDYMFKYVKGPRSFEAGYWAPPSFSSEPSSTAAAAGAAVGPSSPLATSLETKEEPVQHLLENLSSEIAIEEVSMEVVETADLPASNLSSEIAIEEVSMEVVETLDLPATTTDLHSSSISETNSADESKQSASHESSSSSSSSFIKETAEQTVAPKPDDAIDMNYFPESSLLNNNSNLNDEKDYYFYEDEDDNHHHNNHHNYYEEEDFPIQNNSSSSRKLQFWEEDDDDEESFYVEKDGLVGDPDLYWSGSDANQTRQQQKKQRKKQSNKNAVSAEKFTLRSTNQNSEYAKAVVADYLRLSRSEELLLKFRELFDDYSTHQFYSTMYIWTLNFLTPTEMLVRVMHILQEAYYIYDPIQGKEISLQTLQNNREAMDSYQLISQQMKHEFYQQFCQMLPMEIQQDIQEIPLFHLPNHATAIP